MKIYVPAPTQKERVLCFEVTSHGGGVWRRDAQPWAVYYRPDQEGKTWFRSRDHAWEASADLTRKRIASLEAQITKLKGFLGEAPNA